MSKKNFLLILCLAVVFLSVILFIPSFLKSLNPSNPLPSNPLGANPRGEPPPPSKTSSHFPFFKLKNSQLTTLIAVGDIMPGRYCNVQMLKQKDWLYPFLKTSDLTRSADIAFGNLETPIIQNCPTTETGMIFCARPEAVEGLRFAGFDVLSLANNHILNYGQNGLEQTRNFLEKGNLLYSPSNPPNPLPAEASAKAGPLNPTIKTVNDINFGFLSFDLVASPQTPLIPQISLISPTVDILIVSLHWGAEYQKQPTEEQKKLAHQIIDAGAKIIIGHHPHVIQPTESYHDGLIFYSLGNFVFDQPWSKETKKGNLAKILFEEKNIKSYDLIPIYIQDSCQPDIEND